MYTLSIVLNLHREGNILANTISNLRDILDFSFKHQPNWSMVEVIAVLDTPDKATEQIAYENGDLFSEVKVIQVKDLALARNYGISIARGNFILFADGDDYFSQSCLVLLYKKFFNHYSFLLNQRQEAIQLLSYSDHIAIFPKFVVQFPKVSFHEYVDSNEYITDNMKFAHCYISRICCLKALLTENKFYKNEMLYGYEDWDLNNRLLSLGVKFLALEDYVLYYRSVEQDSLLNKQVLNKCIVRNSELYLLNTSLYEEQGNNGVKLPKFFRKTKSIVKSIFYKGKITYYLQKLKAFIFKVMHRKLISKHFNFLKKYQESNVELKDRGVFYTLKPLSEKLLASSIAFWEISNYLKNKEILFIIPWLKLGGADKVIKAYIDSVRDTYSIGIITTLEPGDKAPLLQIEYLNLNYLAGWSELIETQKLDIILKSIINLDSLKFVHCVQSDLGYKIIKYYSAILHEYNKKIISSLFCPDYDWEKEEYYGYPFMYKELFNGSNIVLSDNQYWYKYFKEINNDTDFAYLKLSSPVENSGNYKKLSRDNTYKVLWASRICEQKLFKVFAQIVLQMPSLKFVIYGNVPDDKFNKALLNNALKLPNVEFRGEYSTLAELNIDEFDLFLYTSLFDGVPNVILEMAMFKLPIIAANIGGITEVLGDDYPFLVQDVMNSSSYINKIIEFYSYDKELLQDKLIQIQQFVEINHSLDRFKQKYLDILLTL